MERKNRWFLACLAALLLLGGCQPSEENTEDPTPQQQEETKGPEQDGTSTEGPVVEEEGDVSENVASVLEVMLTGPNEKLYNPDMVTIVGLGEDMTEEEKQKKEMEVQMLQLRYYAVQSQMNPHFIYNALEVVNAMGKLHGSEEICKVVRYISMFLRQNTRNMEKRFIPVRCEIDSLSQYAHIYGYIYGNILSTPFSMEPGTEEALIPTMILQPVLENALVYGVRSEHSVVALTVRKTPDGDLCLIVEDNGAGMPPEMVQKILDGEAQGTPETKPHPSSGVGVRNVRDRLALIYGDKMRFEIDSTVGQGTKVRITVPLIYSEEELTLEPKAGERPA